MALPPSETRKHGPASCVTSCGPASLQLSYVKPPPRPSLQPRTHHRPQALALTLQEALSPGAGRTSPMTSLGSQARN